jgi:hypothetical protein
MILFMVQVVLLYSLFIHPISAALAESIDHTTGTITLYVVATILLAFAVTLSTSQLEDFAQ